MHYVIQSYDLDENLVPTRLSCHSKFRNRQPRLSGLTQEFSYNPLSFLTFYSPVELPCPLETELAASYFDYWCVVLMQHPTFESEATFVTLLYFLTTVMGLSFVNVAARKVCCFHLTLIYHEVMIMSPTGFFFFRYVTTTWNNSIWRTPIGGFQADLSSWIADESFVSNCWVQSVGSNLTKLKKIK